MGGAICPSLSDEGRRKAGALAQTIGTTEDQAELSMASMHRTVRSRTDAFGRAARHSRNVRRLKFVLPVAAVLLAAGFISMSMMSAPPAVKIVEQGTDVADGKLVMANPKLEGFTKKGLPYSMIAGRALQDFEEQGIVTLEGIDAKMPLNEDNWARVQTESGVFNRIENTLEVDTAITVTTSDGLIAKLQSAFLDINNGNLKTSQPVDIQSNGSTITAGSMAILDNGNRVIFETKVRVNIDPDRVKAAEAARRDTDASN
jgi:lipopolysaccharide export system protein LptC